MKYDIVSLVTSIAENAGLSAIVEQPLSHHSTLSLTMKADIPTIHLTQEEEEVWMWAVVKDEVPHSLHYCSTDLLPLMMTYEEEVFITGQPCLYPAQGRLELRAQVKDHYLHSSEGLVSCLDRFLIQLQAYSSVLS